MLPTLLNPYPHHYSAAFAFSVFLYLLPYRQPLRDGFPHREENRLTTFHVNPGVR